jgi:hypothetical protein
MNENLRPVYEKPGMLTAIGIMTLVNGIFNIIWGLSVTAGIVFGTLFIGIICAPITILPLILGIFEIIYALKLLANPPQPVQPNQTLAILEIVAIVSGNVLSAIVGILVLVFYADPTVKNYFAWLNGQPLPYAPVETTPPVEPKPEAAPAAETADVETEAKPEKPKRARTKKTE